jgi:hypothetical protein
MQGCCAFLLLAALKQSAHQTGSPDSCQPEGIAVWQQQPAAALCQSTPAASCSLILHFLHL